MRTSYHNHTLYSDGRATVEEMIAAARRAGLEEIGISDHFVLAADGRRFPWALSPESLEGYVDEILRARQDSGGITIRLGLEIDYFPGMADRVAELLEPYPFDFLIHSVHFVDGFAIDLNAGPWEGLPQNGTRVAYIGNTCARRPAGWGTSSGTSTCRRSSTTILRPT